MAPADALAAAGSSSYSSDSLHVGDGTWDFTKNTFLLPNLMGVNFETMRYNGMANRFSTVPQYHRLILGHGILAVAVFLFIIPASVMLIRFYTRRAGFAVRYHVYLQVLTLLLSTVVLMLGWFAVGPKRSLSNPHHGIGIAIYVLIWVQAIGGRLVRHLAGHHSFRLHLHRWNGRILAVLGIVQVPLGLTLYGSPKYLFILYAVWMAFLLVLYFFLDFHRAGRSGEREFYVSGGRSGGVLSAAGGGKSSSGNKGGMMRWLGPLAAGGAAWALLRRKKDHDRERAQSRTRSRTRSLSRSRSRSRSASHVGRRAYGRGEVVSSRRGSGSSYLEEEKVAGRRKSGGGFMDKILAAGAVAGAGALLSSWVGNRKDRRSRDHDEEYSAVATDTPSRPSRTHRTPGPLPPSSRRNTVPMSESSYMTGDDSRADYRPMTPTPQTRRGGGGVATRPAAAPTDLSATPYRDRPVTPRPSHQRTQSLRDGANSRDEYDSEYSATQSPSKRTPPSRRGGAAGPAGAVPSGTTGKGLFAGMGLGWLASKMARGATADQNPSPQQQQRRDDDDDRRYDSNASRYTGDVHASPSRRSSRYSRRPPPRAQTNSELSDSVLDTVSGGPSAGPSAGPSVGPPVPSYGVTPASGGRGGGAAGGRVAMPAMPAESDSELGGGGGYPGGSGRAQRRRSASRRRRGSEDYGSGGAGGGPVGGGGAGGAGGSWRTPDDQSSKPVSLKLRVNDRSGITVQRMTDADTLQQRVGGSGGGGSSSRPQQRTYHDSASSLSEDAGANSPDTRRYRRDANLRRPEQAAERRTEGSNASAALTSPSALVPGQQQGSPSVPAHASASLLAPSQGLGPNQSHSRQGDYSAPPSSSRLHQPLEPPNPPYAGGRRPKDSAYYSGAPAAGAASGAGAAASSIAPSGVMSGTGGGHTVSSIGSPQGSGVYSAASQSPGRSGAPPSTIEGSQLPDGASSAAAERRRRRKMERSQAGRQSSVDYQ